jgi:hypothetical protein
MRELETHVWWAFGMMLIVVGPVHSQSSPLLSKEGSREAAGWSVQSRAATIDAREALLLLIGTVVFEQTAPALAMRAHSPPY